MDDKIGTNEEYSATQEIFNPWCKNVQGKRDPDLTELLISGGITLLGFSHGRRTHWPRRLLRAITSRIKGFSDNGKKEE